MDLVNITARVQWTEPKGNGKGNLTLIMIPQNNSCTNDTDMLIAVKSDYQVVSQDTQLLNLVINEYQNDTLNDSKCIERENQMKGHNSQNLDVGRNQNSEVNKGNQLGCTDDNIQNKHNPKPMGNGCTDITPAQTNECVQPNNLDNTNGNQRNLNQTLNTPKPGESVSQSYNLDIIGCMKQNNTGGDLSLNKNINQYSELNVPKDISDEIQKPQMYQRADTFNSNIDNNLMGSSQISKATDSISYADLLKYLNSVGEVEQHSELDSVKGPNRVNFYEVEKKNIPLQINEKSNISDGIQNNLIGRPKEDTMLNKGNAVNIFQFLSVAQARETTVPGSKDTPSDVFKFLRVTEQSLVTPHQTTSGYNTVNIKKHFNITDSNGVNSALPISNKNTTLKVFNDSEINIFKLLNITEPNIESKVKKINEGNVVNSTPPNLISDKNILNEAVNIISKLKQEPPKGERNLRSDPLSNNQVAELVALEEGDFDNKAKISKGDYSASAPDEEILKKQRDFFNLNQVRESKADENCNSECNPGVLTTCYVIKADACNISSQKDIYVQTTPVIQLGARGNSATEVYSRAEAITVPTTPPGGSENIKTVIIHGEAEATALSPSATTVSYESTTVSPTPPGGSESIKTEIIYGEAEATALSPSTTTVSYESTTVSPTCRTSIIFICNPQNVTEAYEHTSEIAKEKISEMAEYSTTNPQAAMQESPKKITLSPQVDCASVLNSIKISDVTTKDSNVKPNQDAHFEDRAVYPLVESSLFLANNNEMSKGKNIPVMLNTSSDSMTDVFLSSRDEKLAKFHDNPSELMINTEVVDDIPSKVGRTKNNKRKKIISIKNSNSMENEQVYYPGQVLKMRFAGKKVILEQMPSYRSEVFNKNCEPTPSTEPPRDEMEPDEEENEVIGRAKASKKPQPSSKIISQTGQTESSESTYLQVTTQITSKQPDRTSKMKEKESYTTSSAATNKQISIKQSEITTLPKENEGLMKGHLKLKTTTEQPEKSESASSQITSQAITSQVGTTFDTEGESPIYVTECQTVKVIKNKTYQDHQRKSSSTLWTGEQNDSQTVTSTENEAKQTSTQILGDEYSSAAPLPNEEDQPSTESYLMTDLSNKNTIRTSKTTRKHSEDEKTSLDAYSVSVVMCQSEKITTKKHYYDLDVSVTEKPPVSTPFQKPSKKKQNSDQNVKIPGESVKEIVIQIIRNTKKPENELNTKSCFNFEEDDPVENAIHFQNLNIKRPTAFPIEKIKPGGFEIEMSNLQNNREKNIEYLYPKSNEDESQIGSNEKYTVYPYFGEKSIMLDSTDVGKQRNEYVIPVNTNSDQIKEVEGVIQKGDKYVKALPYSYLKLLVEGNNVINGA